MRAFLAFFFLSVVGALVLLYVPQSRVYVRQHFKRIALIVTGVAVVLFVLFVAMSTSTWRLF